MSDNRQTPMRSIEGHYNYYGIPAYILKQKNGAYASGYFDPVEKVFKAAGSVKKILWDGIKISTAESKRLMVRYARQVQEEAAWQPQEEEEQTPDWVLLPEEASVFIKQADEMHEEAIELMKKLLPTDRKGEGRKS
ncbi:MAG: hypothetical protein MOGMAGMI_02152 [Candidatus Omnitrophica bacterium]|nr:hypothetical protein [Candidatus Omnitrophota bacterium]